MSRLRRLYEASVVLDPAPVRDSLLQSGAPAATLSSLLGLQGQWGGKPGVRAARVLRCAGGLGVMSCDRSHPGNMNPGNRTAGPQRETAPDIHVKRNVKTFAHTASPIRRRHFNVCHERSGCSALRCNLLLLECNIGLSSVERAARLDCKIEHVLYKRPINEYFDSNISAFE